MAKKKLTGLNLHSLIQLWKHNKVVLASKMGMPVGTFKNKLSPTQTAYSFTQDEENKLKDILLEMASDNQEVCGMTFKEALKKIVKS